MSERASAVHANSLVVAAVDHIFAEVEQSILIYVVLMWLDPKVGSDFKYDEWASISLKPATI